MKEVSNGWGSRYKNGMLWETENSAKSEPELQKRHRDVIPDQNVARRTG